MNPGKAIAAASALLLGSCASAPRHPAPPPPPPAPRLPASVPATTPAPVPSLDPRVLGLPSGADTALWISLDSLLKSDYAPAGGVVGAYVMRLGDTGSLWQHNPDTRLLPASTQKIFTAVAGMSLLGGRFHWRTTLWRTGSLQGADLKGDLILEGGGDPTLGGESGALAIFVGALKKQGIETVHGNLVALDTVAGRGLDAWPGGWTVASAKDGYGAPVVGLNWNQNRVGDRALAEPRTEALKALRKALAAKGISVKGTDTTVRVRGDSLPPRRTMTKIATVASPSLDAVLRTCLRESVNPFAEGVVLGLGLGRRGPVRDAGLRRLRDWMQKQGMDPDRMVVDDGSGLSRYDLTTARQMTQFLARDARNDRILLGLLAKGGEGTLRKRFALFPNPAQVMAKTGTLDGVSNLSGYLLRERDTLAFTFFCSGYSGPTRPVRELQDRWLARLQGLPLVRPDSLLRLDSIQRAETLRRSDSAKVDSSRAPSATLEWLDTTRIRPTPVAPSTPPVEPSPRSVREPKDSIAPPTTRDSLPTATQPDTTRVVPPSNPAAPPAPIDSIPMEPTMPPPLPRLAPIPPQPDSLLKVPAADSARNPPAGKALMPTDGLPSRKAGSEPDPLDSFPRPFDPDKAPD